MALLLCMGVKFIFYSLRWRRSYRKVAQATSWAASAPSWGWEIDVNPAKYLPPLEEDSLSAWTALQIP